MVDKEVKEITDISALAYTETGELDILHPVTGEPIGWKWQIAGPSHAVSIQLGDEIARRQIRERHARETAQVNGRKWRPEDETPDKNRKENAQFYARRVLGFNPVRVLGEELHFSTETCRRILEDPKFGWVYRQIAAYCVDDAGFIAGSEKI